MGLCRLSFPALEKQARGRLLKGVMMVLPAGIEPGRVRLAGGESKAAMFGPEPE